LRRNLRTGVLALAVRQQRDFGALLTLIRAHALLHRGSRSRNGAEAIIAAIEDYAIVRELVAEAFAEGMDATVPTTVRESVDAVSSFQKSEVSLGEVRFEACAGQERHQSPREGRGGPGLPCQS
jgi:hypothetical protein